VGTPTDLFAALRRSGTKGAPSLRPYASAALSLERVAVKDLVPRSKYVLAEEVRTITSLREALRASGLDLFNLECGLAWQQHGAQRAVAAPVIEFWEDEGFLLIDGIHRVWLARAEGVEQITCAVVREVSVPLVPLPLEWHQVREYRDGTFPQTMSEKRDFRFKSAAELRASVPEVAEMVTDDNYSYFLFRELTELGSSGVRRTL